MAQTIKLKRSATAGAIPTTSQLELGEVAINTYDGKMYIKKSVGGTETIVEIGTGDGIYEEYIFTATASQTTFSGSDDNSLTLSYVAGSIQVFLNGLLLDPGVDFTATNGTSVVLASAASASDLLQIFAFKKKISDGSVTVNTFSGNNTTTAFTLSLDPGDENNTRVFIDGVYQSKANYSVSGTTLTFSTAPPTGTAIEVEIGNRNVTLDTTANLDLPDNVKLRLGTSQDLEIYHDGSHSRIKDTGTGNLILNTQAFRVNGADDAEGMIKANQDGDVELYYDGSKKFETTSTGATVTGTLVADGISIGDSEYIYAGDSNDLRIFHNGSGINYIQSYTSAELRLESNGNTTIRTNNNEDMAVFTKNGAVTLYYDNAAKIATTNTGIDVTGNIVTSGEIRGPATFVIDPAAVGDNTGTVQIKGNLQVDGTTTTINSTTLDVSDLNITVAKGAATAAAANGAGITIDGASATLTYGSSNDNWIFNKSIDVTGTVTASSGPSTFNSDSSANTVNLDGRSSDNIAQLNFRPNGGASNYSQIQSRSTELLVKTLANIPMSFHTNNTKRLGIANDGDISFYEDGGTNVRMNWDASAESLVLGSLNSLRSGSVSGMNNAQLAIESIAYNPAFIIDNQDNATSPGMLILGTSRGTSNVATAGGVDIVQASDAVGSLRFAAADGTDLRSNIAEILAVVTPGTTPAQNAVSGDLRFQTTNQGQNTTAHMTLTNTGHVGIGTTTPAFTSGSGLQIYNAGQANLRISSTTNNTDFAQSGADAYIINRVTSGDIKFRVNGSTELITLDGGTGSVGISQIAPSSTYKLDVGGAIRSATAAPSFALQETDASNQTWLFASYAGTVAIRDVTGGTYPLQIEAATPSNTLYLDSTGVGIGTASPDSLLHLKSTGDTRMTIESPDANDAYINFSGATNEMSLGFDKSDSAMYITNHGTITSNRRVTIKTDGNVGINTTSPQMKLQVNGNNQTFAAHFGQGTANTSGDWGGISLGYSEASNNNYRKVGIAAKATGDGAARQELHFLVDSNSDGGNADIGDSKMMIDINGNVGIGTTSPSVPLHVDGSARFDLSSGESLYLYRSSASDLTIGLGSANTEFSSAGTINFKPEGTTIQKYQFKSADFIINGPNVGIGTTSPRTKINVQSSVGASSYTGAGPGDLIRASGSGAGNWIASEDDGAMAYFGIDSNQGKFAAYNYATSTEMSMILGQDRMYIQSGGNVGIGTTSPSKTLHVYTSANEAIFMQGTASGVWMDMQVSGGNLHSIGAQSNGMGIYNRTASAYRFFITDAGNVGIGAAGASSPLHVTKDLGSGGNILQLTNADSTYNQHLTVKFNSSKDIEFEGASGNGAIIMDSGSRGTRFQISSTDIGRFDADGLLLEAGKGIKFSPHASANILDDYEEGTWTVSIKYDNPSTGTAATLSEAGGSYTRIGRMVTINAEVDVSNTNSGTGAVYFLGFPFPVADIITPTGVEASGSVSYFAGFSSAVGSMSIIAEGGTSYGVIYCNTSGTQTAASVLTGTIMGTGELRFSITYFTT